MDTRWTKEREARARVARPWTLRSPWFVLAAIVVVLSFGGPSYVLTVNRMAPAPAQRCTGSVLASSPSEVQSIERDAQDRFHRLLNELRGAKGLAGLVWNEPITGPSIEWSETMSTQIPPGGSAADPGWLHHARDKGANDGVSPDQDYVNINSKLVPNWRRLAENVGVGGMRSSCTVSELRTNTERIVDALHDAFVNSPGHYKNMVGDHNQVGIGVHIDDDELWVTVRFANGDLPRGSQPPSGSTVSTNATVTPEMEAYLDEVYRLFIGRSPSSNEMRQWADELQRGDRLAVTRALAVTDAWAGVRVNDMYRTVLGRSANSSGRAYWVDQISRGLTLEAAAVEFYASAEYYANAGKHDDGFIRALYDDLLGRTANASGVRYWKDRMRAPDFGQRETAANFYLSVESRTDRADALFREVFGRAPSAQERNAWADRLAQVGGIVLSAEMAATDAYWNRAVS